MLARLARRLLGAGHAALSALRCRLLAATKPAAPLLITGALADLCRSKPGMVAENALLRQQPIVLKRSVKRPRCISADRALLVLLAGRVRWACDFLPVADLLCRSLYAFVVIALGSRRVVRVSVTRHPTDARVAQQLRQATPLGQHPRRLIRDRDTKYGPTFARLAAGTGIVEVRTA